MRDKESLYLIFVGYTVALYLRRGRRFKLIGNKNLLPPMAKEKI